jgi:uncharacterized SAM-binding protein YcdF (DUF218 family)
LWIAVAGLGLYLAGAVLFLTRADDPLSPAAAIVVLAGGEERLSVALALARDGVAPILVVSRDPSGRDPRRSDLCRDAPHARAGGVAVLCPLASPFSTRGESRVVARLVRERGWERIVVVTSRYHLFRAERLLRRCTSVELVMRGAPDPWWQKAIAVPFEWAKLALAETVRRGC